METQSIEHNKSTTIQSRKPPMGVWLILKGFGIRQKNRIVRHIFSHFSVEIDNMSNFRLWTECVLMQFPWKLLFLVHLWIYTQHELITTGSLAYILVTARRKKRNLSSLSSYQKRDGNACVISMVSSPGIDVTQRKLLCKTRVQSVIMACGIGPLRSAITLAVSFVFPQ